MNLNVCLKKANSIQWNGMNFLTAACLLLAFACFNHYFIFLTSAVIYLNQHIHQIYLIYSYYLISSLLTKTFHCITLCMKTRIPNMYKYLVNISLVWYHLIMSISFYFLPRQAIPCISALAIDNEMVWVYIKSWGYEKVMRSHRKWSTTNKLENPVKWAIY